MVQKIETLVGPMNSGKSAELIRRLNRERPRGTKIIVFKPALDDRTDAYIGSRDGQRLPATVVESSAHLLEIFQQKYSAIKAAKPSQRITVGIEEGQFFDEHLPEVALIISRQFDCKVIISGLLRDFRREGFGPMPQILTISSEIVTFSAICTYLDPETGEPCGEEAFETYRSLNGKSDYFDPIIITGDVEKGYGSRCPNHHFVTNHPQDDLYSK